MTAKRIFLSSILFSTLQFCGAQPGEWVWLHGANTLNSPGSFGIQGVSSPTNAPPAFYEACQWTDQNGKFWLFGGLMSGFSAFADLWKYDPVTNEWTWMHGNGIAGDPGNFGVQGVAAATNLPPAREHGVITWVDLSNNLWLYGGYSVVGELSDLWKYDISSNQWTWMKGPTTANNPGTYGTQGVPSPANNPSSREEAASAWTDGNGDLWFFGGWGTGTAALNDLWRFSIATSEWTWMKGSQLFSQPGVYGTFRVEDPANVPGARCAYTHWKDNSGNFWFFGGEDFSANTFNDMWRFNPLTNNWTWMNGSNFPGASANYGTKCVTDSIHHPGTRYENRAVWTDVNGNFWIFGGNTTYLSTNYKNDLWMYCVSNNTWTWVSGDNTNNPAGNWGTIGISSPLNKPSGRMGSVGWMSASGEIYLFGGTTTPFGSFYNDLWKFTPDPGCASCNTVPIALFTAPNHICPGTCTDFDNNSVNATSFQWIFDGANPGVSTDVNPTGICYPTPGSYSVTLIANGPSGSDTLMLNNFITVYPYPAPQGITQSGDTLIANGGATSYQWYFSGNLIPGATDYFYLATQSGDYNVVATDNNGCEVEAAIFDVIASLQDAPGNVFLVYYPNPVDEFLTVEWSVAGIRQVTICNLIGERVLSSGWRENTGAATAGERKLILDVESLARGMYYLEISGKDKQYRGRFIKR